MHWIENRCQSMVQATTFEIGFSLMIILRLFAVLLQSLPGSTYNIGGNQEYTNLEVVQNIVAVFWIPSNRIKMAVTVN